jgi:glutamine amidotransferase
VGAFGDAMKELKALRLVDPIKAAVKDGKPFLGLCLGMQLLFDGSDEAPGVKGLSILGGRVKRFNFSRYTPRSAQYVLKVPHMGWNSIVQRPPRRAQHGGILRGIPRGSYMYFVHSYYVKPKEKDVVLTTTEYGSDFASGVRKDNVYGLQFHPEKSQEIGLKILKNFVRLRA